MPGQSKGKNGTKATSTTGDVRADFVGYINISLGEKDKADFDLWVEQSDVVFEGYMSALELGYQFTSKFDKSSGVCICSASNWVVGREDSGIIYTARSDDPNKALLKAIYVVCRKTAFNLSDGYVKRQNTDAF